MRRSGGAPGQQEDPSRSWLFGDDKIAEANLKAFEEEVARRAQQQQHHNALADAATDQGASIVKMKPSPEAGLGTAADRQRVIQVCVGMEHGVMLTDAAIAYTWGDNRYGQLGRPPRKKQENKEPFPVLDLLQMEVQQVASGDHHCLALCAPGEVWGWGRNKHGQLGTGDIRDKVKPDKVMVDKSNDKQLGGDEKKRIITINAGGRSSVAASQDSSIYQWGEINDGFKDMKKPQGQAGDTDKPEVKRDSPAEIFSEKCFLTNCRKDGGQNVSITEVGCRILPEDKKGAYREQIKDLVTSLGQLQAAIVKNRDSLAKQDTNKKEEKGGKGGDNDVDEKSDFKDTIALYEREHAALEFEIQTLQKAQKSLELQQEDARAQRQQVHYRSSQLNSKLDEKRQRHLSETKTSDKKKLEEEVAEIRKLISANDSAKETLEQQCEQNTKEKNSNELTLSSKSKKRDDLAAKLQTLREVMSKSTEKKADASDELVGFLEKKSTEIRKHFEGRASLDSQDNAAAAAIKAYKDAEDDENFLRGIETAIEQRQVETGVQDQAQRRTLVHDMLRDLVTLRRIDNELRLHQHAKDDQDFSEFFKDRKHRKTGGLMHLPGGGR